VREGGGGGGWKGAPICRNKIGWRVWFRGVREKALRSKGKKKEGKKVEKSRGKKKHPAFGKNISCGMKCELVLSSCTLA